MNMLRMMYAASAALVACSGASAALFSGPATFSTLPHSQMGPVIDMLVLTDTATGFVVTGQLHVNVVPGFTTGLLAAWEIDRPLDPTFGASVPLTSSTVIDGFVLPPSGGTYGNTSGVVESYFSNFAGTSLSSIPLTLTSGATTWLNVTQSTPFLYTSGGVNYLRQSFWIDGTQLSGPGGNWIVDVPVTSSITPSPGTLTLLLGCGAMAGRRRGRG